MSVKLKVSHVIILATLLHTNFGTGRTEDNSFLQGGKLTHDKKKYALSRIKRDTNDSSLYTMLGNMNKNMKKMRAEMQILQVKMEMMFKEQNKNRENEFSKVNEIAYGYRKFYKCGGTNVAESGLLQVGLPENDFSRKICVWTVRANYRNKVRFNMVRYEINNYTVPLNTSFVLLSPYKLYTEASNFTHPSTKIMLDDFQPYEVDGPLVFVTLVFTPSQAITKFGLQFQGISSNSSQTVIYSHYHYSQGTGEIKYPFNGREKYRPNEIATFVINPTITSTLNMVLNYAYIENQSICKYDSLTLLINSANFGGSYYNRYGMPNSDFRFCGNQTNIKMSHTWEISTSILIFKSDGSSEMQGFKFSW